MQQINMGLRCEMGRQRNEGVSRSPRVSHRCDHSSPYASLMLGFRVSLISFLSTARSPEQRVGEPVLDSVPTAQSVLLAVAASHAPPSSPSHPITIRPNVTSTFHTTTSFSSSHTPTHLFWYSVQYRVDEMTLSPGRSAAFFRLEARDHRGQPEFSSSTTYVAPSMPSFNWGPGECW